MSQLAEEPAIGHEPSIQFDNTEPAIKCSHLMVRTRGDSPDIKDKFTAAKRKCSIQVFYYDRASNEQKVACTIYVLLGDNQPLPIVGFQPGYGIFKQVHADADGRVIMR